MKLKAYPKINLTLDITGRRGGQLSHPDTVMHSVSVMGRGGDPRGINKPGIRLFQPGVPSRRYEEHRLSGGPVFRALRHHGAGPFHPHPQYIPTGREWGRQRRRGCRAAWAQPDVPGRLPLEALVELGAKVGADVPFCGGRGLPLPGHWGTGGKGALLPECWLVLCKPPAGMSTPPGLRP